MPICFIILIASLLTYGDVPFQYWHRYQPLLSFAPLSHRVVLVPQLSMSVTSQALLPLLIKKGAVQVPSLGWVDLLKQQHARGYQLFISSHYYPNELWGMGGRYIHYYRTHQVRLNTTNLVSERRIIQSAFRALDKLVVQKRTARPICLIIVLPPEAMHSMGRGGVAKTPIDVRRDFSVAYMYHELHKRRYLYPATVLIYPQPVSSGDFLLKKP